MIRISGRAIPVEKRLEIGLTYIYGIGRSTAKEIMQKIGFEESIRGKDLNPDQVIELQNLISSEYIVEGKKASEVFENIKLLKKMNCYRGIRLRNGLPVRGQSTRNAGRKKMNRGMPSVLGPVQKKSPSSSIVKKGGKVKRGK